MKRALRISAQASKQLREISSYILRESGHPELAQAFRRRLVAKARQLDELPGTLGSDRPDLGEGIRSTPVSNYILTFRYTEQSLDLPAVLHASRDIVSHFDND
ncbi:type II toxin-antitoxin system RelE/ParE family toxin [Blastomonas sp. SL216]|uniref:type II toxin-antitoxin system RelE/ParE family toxin n=1 Tax=Blastomonas sp. SL216 TaxID=2995169 RepID=UPI002377AE96|nr:type II toxin-antitoxin system RelE/ParE family toxin [Blastomonas sp. SL216]